jgi:CheY-like chemotaxis protein
MSKVLVVDDDANNRLLLSALLKHDHHTVIEATNGAQGLASVAEQIPDLVIVDLNMPEIDGVTFVRRVRENSDFRHVKIALDRHVHDGRDARFSRSLRCQDRYPKTVRAGADP